MLLMRRLAARPSSFNTTLLEPLRRQCNSTARDCAAKTLSTLAAAPKKEEKSNVHVVLFHPRIPGNTGNAGRTCLGFGGTALHLVKPYGFEITEAEVKRAGLDYWKDVDLREHDSWANFRQWLDGHREEADEADEADEAREAHEVGEGELQCKKEKKQKQKKRELYLFSKSERLGARSLYDTRFFEEAVEEEKDIVLLFGSETTGVAELEESGELQELVEAGTAKEDGAGFAFRPPVFLEQSAAIRSFNLATAVAMVLFEVHRQKREAERP